MAIRRGFIPADAFTIIANAWLRDPRLTWKGKGLLAYIASHAAGHRLTLDQIVAEGKDGIDAVRAAMAELEEAGYLCRIDVRNERGHRIGTDYELCEPAQVGFSQVGESAPSADQQERDVSAGQPQTGKSQVGKSDPKKTTPPKKTTEKTPSPSARGTRIPDDWAPSSKLGEWMLSKLPEGRWSEHSRKWVLHETEKFTLYWKVKTGRDATKIDWDRTWQKWMLTALERYRPAATGNGPGSGAPQAQFQTAAEKAAQKVLRDTVRARLVDALMEQGAEFDAAYEAAEAEVARRLAAGEPLSVDSCTVPGYIDGKVISDTATTAREVTS